MLRNLMLTRTVAGALALSLVAAACASDDATESEETTEETTEVTEAIEEEETEVTEAEEEEEEANEGDTIVDIAAGNPDFSILVEAITEADLVDALSAEGELTVFAPTNDAFAAFLEEQELTEEDLLASPDLADILQYHVLATKVDAAAALTAAEANESVETLQGGTLELSLDGENIKVANATVVSADIEASNGIIHAVDQVIPLPA